MKSLISFSERPTNIDEIIGQEHIIGKNKIITNMINNNFVFSIIFHGQPGVGKTSLAISICKTMKLPYKIFNAAFDKKNVLEEIIEISKISSSNYVVIIDEIHRMNRDKQDILLSFLEKGNLILFGTTTENPYFSINPAIRSRCKLIELNSLKEDDIKKGLENIAKKNSINITSEALDLIVKKNLGDYRSSINLLEILFRSYKENKIDKNLVLDMPFGNYSIFYKEGNEIHDLKSALQKSIRGSDPDASIYWLARLLESSDIETIGRRILICSYEDIGLANPSLLSRVYSAISSSKEVGMPEAKYILSYIVLEMALSPKSNSASTAIAEALDDLNDGKKYDIPENIRKNNNGKYLYPHNYPNGWVKQNYLPKEIINKKYYIAPKHSSIENKILKYWDKIKGEI
ncbi:MAG: replication-associated recombination protein A [Mycoplasmoidaceae bacterium]